MALFIKLINGSPSGHPIAEDNFRMAFPEVDTNNLPEDWATFTRVSAPLLGPYEKNQRSQYEIQDDGTCLEVWSCDDMTDTERQKEKDLAAQRFFASGAGFSSWVFNEDTCSYDPPVPVPDTENTYDWDDQNEQWVAV